MNNSFETPFTIGKNICLAKCKAFAFDMDGTLVLGDVPTPCSSELVTYLRDNGFRVIIVTNNSSVSNRGHAERLSRTLGLTFTPNDIYSSLDHVGRYLSRNWKGAKVFPLLTQEAQAYLSMMYDVKLTDDEPDLIVVGFDRELTYLKLERASIYIQRGTPWILAHPDYRCPTERGFIPDAGSIAKLLELTTNTHPIFVGGKPSREFLSEVSFQIGTPVDEICYVGDRLYTDMKMALETGAQPILLLSGETTEADLEKSELRGNQRILVFEDPCHLLSFLRGLGSL